MTSHLAQSIAMASMLIGAGTHAQTEHFVGQWTKEGTTYVFDFVLTINHLDGGAVNGQFNWTVARPDELAPESIMWYESKIGHTAIEYVRGSYDNSSGELLLQGYKKEDPNLIISLDHYRLKIIGEHTLQGNSKAHGTWQGVIDGKRSTEQSL